MKRRVIWTVLLLAAFGVFTSAYNSFAPVYETDAALGQMENSDEAYSFGRLIATWDPTYWVGALILVVILCMWVPALLRGLQQLSQET